ncbi:MAG: Rnase Y domain-containing protein, partial [Acidobacteriota bacterium]
MDSLTWGGLCAAFLLVGILAGWFANHFIGQRSLARARSEGGEILHQAQQDAKRQRQAASLAAREERQRARRRSDRELRERRSRLSRQQAAARMLEKQLTRRQGQIQEKEKKLEEDLAEIQRQQDHLAQRREELQSLMDKETARLENISGLTAEEARDRLMETVRKECRLQAARLTKESREEATRNADREAQKIIALAVERSASDFSSHHTITAVPLENDKLKGRLIGHEGKNIKAFEAASGMQMVVDDTPNQVIISGFHPVKREIARLSLEKLLKDGNIHPRRIEETVRKMKKRANGTMRKAAEEALKELRIRRVHPEMVNLLGRLHYRTSYGQNVLIHSKEVAYLTGIMAAELGLKEGLARRAGLFHDIGKAIDYEREGT